WVICANTDADLRRPVEDVVARYVAADAVDLLINYGAELAQLARGRTHHEIALRVHLEPVDSLEGKYDGVRVGAGCQHEVVFDPAFTPVVHEIDARIDADVPH